MSEASGVSYSPRLRDIPAQVRDALLHVRSFIPEVDRVVFWEDGRWAYMTDDHKVPTFGSLIDVSILEAAGDAVANLSPGAPITYQLGEEDF